MSNLKTKLAALRAVRDAAAQGEYELKCWGETATGIDNTLQTVPEHYHIGRINCPETGDFIVTAANEWTSLITALERAVATLDKCTCGEEHSWEEKSCANCEALTDIEKILEEK